ncbi:MAG: sigma-70 family RNA polymerase sigma factor [Deltaproteobacteria bacterium]|nr:sigma-70 family RNA polymerase sigma factor [Deltaproteobacteria bacterium]
MTEDIKTTINLVNKAKAGEGKALDLLLERYMGRVLKIVRMRLGAHLRQKTESMDIVQEVMIRALNGFETFEPKDEAAFLHWISKLVSNEIRDLADYHQAQKRDLNKEHKKAKDQDPSRSVISNLPAKSMYRPSFQVQLKQEVLELETALDQLSEDQRDVVVMRQYEGMSFKDIAEMLNTTEDAARMKFARAIDKLTDLMSDG